MTHFLSEAVRFIAADAVWTVVAAVLAVVPGLGLSHGLSRRLGWGWPSVLTLAVATSSALAGVAGLACYLLGASLLAASVAFLVLAAATWAAGLALGRGRPSPELGRDGLIAGAVAAGIAVVQGPYMGVTGDSFYHLSAIRSLLVRDQPMVTDPFYGTAVRTLDPTSGIWHTMLGIWSRLTGLDPVGPWIGLNAVGAAALVMALWALLRWVGGSERWASWGIAGYMLFSLFSDFRVAGLPRNGSLFIVFVGLLAFLTLLETRRWSAAAVAFIGGFAAFTVHIGSAVLLLASIASIGAFLLIDAVVAGVRDRAWDFRRLGAIAGTGAIVGLSAASALLPKLLTMLQPARGAGGESVFALASVTLGEGRIHWPGGLVSFDPGFFPETGGVVLTVLVVAMLVPMAVAAFGRERDTKALGGIALASLPALLLFDPIGASLLERVSPYLTERLVPLMPFATWVAVAWCLARAGAGRARTAARWLAYAALAASLVAGAPYVLNTWTGKGGVARVGNRYPVYVTRLIDMRYSWGLDTLAKFRDAVGSRYPRIAGDLESTYYMTALEPVCALASLRSHSPFVVEHTDGEQRRADNAAIISPDTSDQRRADLLARWKVDYVVLRLDRRDPLASAQALRRSSAVRVLLESRNLIVFEAAR